MNSAFGWINGVSSGALSVGSAAANSGPENLQIDQGSPSLAWQTRTGVLTDAAGAWLVIDSGNTATTWQAFSLFRTNMTTAATVRWKVGNTLSAGRVGGSLAYDSGTISAGVMVGYQQSVVVSPAAVVGRYCELALNDPSNPDAFLNIPLAFAGPLFFPLSGITFASTVGRTDQTDETVSRGGQEYPTNRYVQRQWVPTLSGIRLAEVWPSVMELDRVSRLGGNVLFVPDYLSTNLQTEAVFGRVKGASQLSFPYGAGDRRAWSATVAERL